MQIIYLPTGWTMFLIFLLWPLFQGGAALLCHQLSDSVFKPDGSIFRSRRWEEDGRIYQRLFRIRQWKNRLPESSQILKGTFNKGKLKRRDPQGIQEYLKESCRAELIHWLGIPPFLLFGFFVPASALFFMGLYALVFNLPFIMIQRFNRPRILKYQQKRLDRF